ncbi:hypothetical protein [Candidatus Sororendozoicomonas aggregata]|uniref:hypothetical protein n=1 Tax=Candidatus Sororendozoicomonas aggregata TaxID=3073239 RepID=UPI002ED686FA
MRLIPFEEVLPRETRFKILPTRALAESDKIIPEDDLVLQADSIGKNTLSYILLLTGIHGGAKGCITLRYFTPYSVSGGQINFSSEHRYIVLNIAIDVDFGRFCLENLLLYVVSIKLKFAGVSTLYVDHPALSEITFFEELGFAPVFSSHDTDTEYYWSNEPPLDANGENIKLKTNRLMGAFRENQASLGVGRSPYNWYINNMKLFEMLRGKVKKSFEKLPDNRFVKYPDPFAPQ